MVRGMGEQKKIGENPVSEISRIFFESLLTTSSKETIVKISIRTIERRVVLKYDIQPNTSSDLHTTSINC